jgi:hypothetical protein
MITAAEYREYAHECARWAAETKSDEMRNAFLDMANHWLAAALKVDGLITPVESEAPAALPPRRGVPSQR